MRIKFNNEVVSLDDQATLGNLKKVIGVELSELRAGYPPKPLDLKADDKKLVDLGIRSGEKLMGKFIGLSDEGAGGSRTGTGSAADTAVVAAPHKQDDGRSTKTGSSESSPSVRIPSFDLYLKLRIMEDDNSCLFRAVGYCLMKNLDTMFELRSIVADEIRKNPVEYNDAILGKPRQEYIRWILKENSWGGAIELQILAKHFYVTICSLDVSTLRVDRFNPGANSFIIIVYSGIHYDAAAATPLQEDHDNDLDVTVFQPDEQGSAVLESLLELGKNLKTQNYYTDTAAFLIKCKICGLQFKGEKSAIEHARLSGHSDFGEV